MNESQWALVSHAAHFLSPLLQGGDQKLTVVFNHSLLCCYDWLQTSQLQTRVTEAGLFKLTMEKINHSSMSGRNSNMYFIKSGIFQIIPWQCGRRSKRIGRSGWAQGSLPLIHVILNWFSATFKCGHWAQSMDWTLIQSKTLLWPTWTLISPLCPKEAITLTWVATSWDE